MQALDGGSSSRLTMILPPWMHRGWVEFRFGQAFDPAFCSLTSHEALRLKRGAGHVLGAHEWAAGPGRADGRSRRRSRAPRAGSAPAAGGCRCCQGGPSAES